ncbi:hypothetical protein C5Y96_07755 [Blastopirellula marina]|uniref:Thioredoxin domain-containing protein n=1 Tax=Blastopirellula marina TaxID=124 RepID=A0A2S8FYT3_9BACT|nr:MULTISPECIES: TlpA disulfide reductase family protein [Pirellulaceae]PQO37044.1 hypothetical protein C5Y96_07755 [Blastopirellula marina]RCS53759.1 TlpA family protein disulfide reductase [Bremerella cremea]
MSIQRIVLSACVCLSLFTFMACGRAADAPAAAAEPAAAPGEVLAKDELKAFVADPSDIEPLVDFTNANFEALMKEMSGPGEIVRKHIEGMRESLVGVQAGDNQEAIQLLDTIERSLEAFETRLTAKGRTLEDIKSDVSENPGNITAINLYALKIDMVFNEDMNDDVEKMETFVNDEAQFIIANNEKVEDAAEKIAYKKAAVVLQSCADDIQRFKAYAKLIGQPMTPIDTQSWVNGHGYTSEELKGKVVLLDFWAVWCGPCVAGFPHLVEWQDKYGKDGLQVIGVTRYFNFNWPAGAEGPQQVEDKPVPEAEEVAMLDKFTAEHNLKHPTALMAEPDADAFYDAYAVSVIPHMVLIGRDGKIRKVIGGIGDAQIKMLEEEMQKALAEPAPN